MLKIATVFSGIGAIEHALDRMQWKHKIIFACDIDKFVKQSYFANYDIDDERWYDDIKKIDGCKYHGVVDILAGGSPCQSFSMVGKRKGLDDLRGMLVFEFIRLIKEIKPKVFIYENVRGLLSNYKGKTWEIICNEFKALGYNINYEILNAKDYGIPQNRERLFVVGLKDKNKSFSFPPKMELKLVMKDLLEDTVNPVFNLPPKGINFVTKDKNIKKKYTQINGEIALCQKRNQQFNWHGDFVLYEPKEIDSKYYLSDKVEKYVTATGTKNFYSKPKLDLDVARPLLSTMHKMHRAGVDNYVTHSGRIRKLTPRECLRLMGFDDRFKIVVSNTQMYKQAGNSIVVNILVELLNNLKSGVLGSNGNIYKAI
jgi:DNA (cytosine-5)-methyltransferase 1